MIAAWRRPSDPRARYVRWIGWLFGVYACLYIYRLSFVIDGVRYFTLADDQMISMRYAENLARGAGLVWNAHGPRVEGYTNFAWVLYMALFHAMHIPRPIVSVFIQVSGAVFLFLTFGFVRRIAGSVSDESEPVVFVALALSAFYIPLDNWAFQGTEVSLLTFIVTACTWLMLRTIEGRPPYSLYVLLGATTLVRPDMVTFIGAVLSGLALAQRDRWARHLLVGGAIAMAFLAAETAFRLIYFGDILPNTYYLKMTGFPLLPRVTRGLFRAAVFAAGLLPLALPLAKEWKSVAQKQGVRLMLWVFGVQVAYSIFIGGDVWEWWGGSNRFIAIAMPVFFIACAVAIGRIYRLRTVTTQLVILTIVFVVSMNLVGLASYKPVPRLLLIEPSPENRSDEANVRAALELREHTRNEAVIAVTWAGSIPYFSERPALDLLGKMDPYIAHEPMHQFPDARNWLGFYPGHLKWDYQHSIRVLKPDVIQAPLWQLSYELDTPEVYLTPGYELRRLGTSAWYVRTGSSNLID